jgi:1,4-alpha-glucan branching enzyme
MQPRHPRSRTVARPVALDTQTAERPVEKPHDFVIQVPQAKSVTVAGNFNDWDPARTPLRKGARGNWKTTVWLPPGRYEYRFVVDGVWTDDPKAGHSVPNGFGAANAVVEI